MIQSVHPPFKGVCIAVSISFPVYCLAAALIAWLLLRVEDIISADDTRASSLAVICGFTFFALVSAGLETALAGGR